MSLNHPLVTAKSGRQFATIPAALVAVIVREDECILMLSSPKRPDQWQPISGAYDGDETLLEGLLREIREEAGDEIRVRPLCAIHACTFRYGEILRYMMSVSYLLAYEGGDVFPGDDMAGSQVRWISVDDIEQGTYTVIIPPEQLWIYRRAVDLYRMLKEAPPVQQEAPPYAK